MLGRPGGQQLGVVDTRDENNVSVLTYAASRYKNSGRPEPFGKRKWCKVARQPTSYTHTKTRHPFVLPFGEWSSASEVATKRVRLIILCFHTISAFPISHRIARMYRRSSSFPRSQVEHWKNGQINRLNFPFGESQA